MTNSHSCRACGAPGVIEIPPPHPSRSMVSDGRVIAAPLARVSCPACGYGARLETVSEADRDVLYDGNYGLGLQDAVADEQRASAYADHILAAIAHHGSDAASLQSIVEFGCGTGALLDAIITRAPTRQALGIEPAAQLAAVAQARLQDRAVVFEGYAETVLPQSSNASLCYSVNVIEHALDPTQFFAAGCKAISEDGFVVTICPDGESAGSELLFFDHISSFSLESLCQFAGRAGLHLRESKPLGGAQSGFRLSVFSPQSAKAQSPSLPFDLTAARAAYHRGWRELGEHAAKMPADHGHAIFGTGEFCDLLHAYAPEFVDNAAFYVVDRPVGEMKFGRTAMSTADFLRDYRGTPLLAAVHARSWKQLRARFAGTSVELKHPFEYCSLRTELQ
ncbi:methyltransferase domain-containing protein [Hyphomicrobium sp.]|uniref:methyltransferase domain-containing protein n=1 Tax=Hyphomicrobium sp. TaxID=82 RepID=UPI002E2EFD04|nr:methyltransferase domain-containing protein [Hyphomicrobium sp.]HEX2841186.1 methyltransferase domain-containing protein [Hyphomicrobium sp.]